MSALSEPQRKVRPLPTLAELEEVEELGTAFHDALENIPIHVEAMDRAWTHEGIEPETLPTHEQIGYLYLFAYYMEMRSDEVRDLAKRVKRSLSGLESIRTDAPLRRARQATEGKS